MRCCLYLQTAIMSKLDKTENLLFLPAQTAKAHTKAHTKVFAFVHFQDKNYVHTNVLAMLAPPAKDVKKKKKGNFLKQQTNIKTSVILRVMKKTMPNVFQPSALVTQQAVSVFRTVVVHVPDEKNFHTINQLASASHTTTSTKQHSQKTGKMKNKRRKLAILQQLVSGRCLANCTTQLHNTQ